MMGEGLTVVELSLGTEWHWLALVGTECLSRQWLQAQREELWSGNLVLKTGQDRGSPAA